MESIIDLAGKKSTWEAFFENRKACGHMSEQELLELSDYIIEERYVPLALEMADGKCRFSTPRLSSISKENNSKKRIVYQFQKDEMWMCKLLSYLMHCYDGLFSDNCYSFQGRHSVRDAIHRILSIKDIDKKYCLKLDIQNYFNSIPVEKLCQMIENNLSEDKKLVAFLCSMLKKNEAIDATTNKLIYGNRGAMAGIPTSPFFANLYLMDVDQSFFERKVLYFRYADDILIFADSREELEEYQKELLAFLYQKGLEVNQNKYKVLSPGEPIEFLGIQYHRGVVDICDHTKKKLFAKIRRKARALYRWRRKKEVSFEKTAHVLIRIFNRKFYDREETKDFCWAKWFFPLINTDKSLKEIDAYLVQSIRYLQSGRHYKGNYKITYETIKDLGFRSLVNEYYKS